ncbi:MAG: hypothetical protein V1646_00990 [bacterium]
MNKKNFISFLVKLIFCFWHSLIIAMPGTDGGAMPGISQAPTTQLPSTTTPTASTLKTTTATALPGIGITAAATVSILPAQYATEAEINNAITEAASPSTPLYTETAGGKSKIEIYKVILKSLSALFANVNLDTKRKIFDGLYTDVLNPIVDTSTYLVSNSALDEVYTTLLGDPSKTTVEVDKYPAFLLLKKVQDDVKKTTSPSSSKYTQAFNKIYTSLLAGRTKLESQIKKQTNFSNQLDAIKAIDSEKVANKIDAYQRLIINVNKSITLTNRKDLITDIGRLVSLAIDDLMRQKVLNLFKFIQANKFFTNAEKAMLAEFEKAKQTAGTPIATAPGTAPTTVLPQAGTIVAPPTTPPTQQTVSIKKKITPTVPAKTTEKKVLINIDNLKKKLTAAEKNNKELIKICYTIISLYPKITSPDNKKALIPFIEDKLTYLYNNRSSLKKEDLNALIIMLEKTKNIPELATSIKPQKLNSLKLITQLNIASSEKVISKKIASYLQISNSITNDIDSFEKGRFIDGVTSLFSLRKQMTGSEVDAFKNLLNNLNSTTFKSKNIIDSIMQKALEDWIKIIECTSILFSQIESKPIKEQIPLLKTTLNKVTVTNAAYERKQLVSVVIPQLFNSRGDLTQEDLSAMKDLLTSIQNTAGLLASNQVSTIVSWIKELDDAVKITTDKKIYISALLDSATNGKDLSLYEKILPLFTPQTPVTVMASFVGALNNIFKARNTFDKKKILKLFQIINLRKLSNGTNLLGPAQKPIMVQWIKILENETKPVQKAVAAAA